MQTVHRLLVPASVAGLVLSTVWNAAAWARLPIAAMESGSSLLFVGVFVVWFPTVFRSRKERLRLYVSAFRDGVHSALPRHLKPADQILLLGEIEAAAECMDA